MEDEQQHTIAGDPSCLNCICIESEPCVYHMFPGEELTIQSCPNNTQHPTVQNWHHNGVCCVCDMYGSHKVDKYGRRVP